MKHLPWFLAMFAASTVLAEPLRLHPDNPHYFLWQGKPEVVITSGEHYGAVLNSEFEYTKYLDTLAKDGLNGTRTFSGAYCEAPGAFNIARNTLAPGPGKLLCPWARSEQPGYANGGNKFDLTKWDAVYFQRLRDFVAQAAQRGVIVEMNLFCPFYEDSMWALSPQNAKNNVNGIGTVDRQSVYTLEKSGGLLAVHEAMTRKVVAELNEYDNLYFEICNEPYFGGVTMEWQRRIAEVIAETEKGLPKHHLISQNVANHKALIKDPHPAISIFNFHYASPPEAVTMNYGLNKVIGDNETGFKGTEDSHYRMEAWSFLINGGALYNHLDYSFVAGHEDGTFDYPKSQPGGGTAALRTQLKWLGKFLREFDFIKMAPDSRLIRVKGAGKRHAYVLREVGKQYAVYIEGKCAGLTVELMLPEGNYAGYWLDSLTGNQTPIVASVLSSGSLTLKVPDMEDGAALRLVGK